MILHALYEYAREEKLVEGMEVNERVIHLVLSLKPDGSVPSSAPWVPLTREVTDLKTGAVKHEPGRRLRLPEFPGVNNGGKANFLADTCEKVLGLNAKTREPVPDDPAKGGNATKAFLHFWQRIADAHAATGLPELAALLEFRSRYLASEEDRRSMPFVGTVPYGKDGQPTLCALSGSPEPLEKANITFEVGTSAGPVFREGSALHDYWRETFNRERFAAAPADGANGRLGPCLVTGNEQAQVAEVHRTLIKGVPGLPPIGGYVVSFDKSSPAFTSYGFEGGWNAPVSETAAAAYALGLNRLLADDLCRRRFGGAVLVSWIDGNHELTGVLNSILLDPPALKDDVARLFHRFEAGQHDHAALDTRRFRSITLAANGGRVVVRRWLDEPLRDAVDALKCWFADLETEAIEVPGKFSADADLSTLPRPLAIWALAATTARVPSEVADGVYDALYRAAFERGFNPRALLAPLLQRLRIAAAQTGNGIRFKTSHFALLKLILIRSQESPMEITTQLSETHDGPYNCGRLLALLDDLQEEAQGSVGADIVARFYGTASTLPRNVFPRMLRLEKHHRAKLLKDPRPGKQAAGRALGRKIDEVAALFAARSPGLPPDFPSLLTPQEQGRFALGFHQQKARNERDRKEAIARKAHAQAQDATENDE